MAKESLFHPARVGLYARVSTANGQQDPELQLSELREHATRRGWEIAEIYTDTGVSGSKDSRPALNRLMADAGQRKFDTVLVWKLDRFGRSSPDQCPGRVRGSRNCVRQPPGQPRPRHALGSADVPDHRRHGRV
jgi:predicted site-specific integrase-resolvase